MVSNALVDNKVVVTSSEVHSGSPPESAPEVVAPAKRRYRTAAFKLRIIAEADACDQRGDLGSLLRREGVYHSDLANWRKQKAHGQLGGSPVSRSRRSDLDYQEALKQQAEMARENRDLRRQLGRAKLIIEIQKKAALLLGETLQEMSLDDPMENEPY
jgi:transposase